MFIKRKLGGAWKHEKIPLHRQRFKNNLGLHSWRFLNGSTCLARWKLYLQYTVTRFAKKVQQWNISQREKCFLPFYVPIWARPWKQLAALETGQLRPWWWLLLGLTSGHNFLMLFSEGSHLYWLTPLDYLRLKLKAEHKLNTSDREDKTARFLKTLIFRNGVSFLRFQSMAFF